MFRLPLGEVARRLLHLDQNVVEKIFSHKADELLQVMGGLIPRRLPFPVHEIDDIDFARIALLNGLRDALDEEIGD